MISKGFNVLSRTLSISSKSKKNTTIKKEKCFNVLSRTLSISSLMTKIGGRIMKISFNVLSRTLSISSEEKEAKKWETFHVSMSYLGLSPFLPGGNIMAKANGICFNVLSRTLSISSWQHRMKSVSRGTVSMSYLGLSPFLHKSFNSLNFGHSVFQCPISDSLHFFGGRK